MALPIISMNPSIEYYPHAAPAIRPQAEDEVKNLYDGLLVHEPAEAMLARSAAWLEAHLDNLTSDDCEMPDDPAQLEAWLQSRYHRVGEQFAEYRSARQAG